MADSLLKTLIETLCCLPGVGQKSAQRMAFHLLERDREGGRRLGETLLDLGESKEAGKRFDEALKLQGADTPRPMTHDLMVELLDQAETWQVYDVAMRERTVTVAVHHLAGWYFSTVIAGVEAVCADAGYDCSVITVGSVDECSRVLGRGGSTSRMIRWISLKPALRSSVASKGVVPVSSS